MCTTTTNATKPPTTLRARLAARPHRKSRTMLPTINVTKANAFVEAVMDALPPATAPPKVSHLSSPTQQSVHLASQPHSPLSPRHHRSYTPPSIPIFRITPTSTPRTAHSPARRHRRVVSVPTTTNTTTITNSQTAPLSSGPLAYTYTPLSSRSTQHLETFLPPEHYLRANASNLSLVVSICGPPEEMVVVCTPGAVHAMGMKGKGRKRDRMVAWGEKGVRKVLGLFRG